jgi:hypothetical protein
MPKTIFDKKLKNIIEVEILKNNLSQFGKVVRCEVIGNIFHCKITEGFDNNAKKLFKVQNLIIDHFEKENPTIVKYDVSKDLFHLIMKL